MGIKSLMKLLQSEAKGCYREQTIKSYFGRAVAIDASMTLYQFLIAVRQHDGQLQNEFGEVTSHIVGFFYRTIRMMENGLKPVYVFDGKPPVFKSGELEKRRLGREKATNELKEAEETGDTERAFKMKKRLVKVERKHVEDVKQLLTAMGVPWVQAPGEAEAQCAEMNKRGVVYGTGTEDMDALTFGTPVLIRHLTHSAARKLPVLEINLGKILDLLGLTMDEFIDMCILCGCDYVKHIKGIGPKSALSLIRKHSNIESILENLDPKRYEILSEEDFNYKAARLLFTEPDVIDCTGMQLKWQEPNEELLIDFLVVQKAFNSDRAMNGLRRLKACRKKGSQKRLDSFFKVQTKPKANNRNSNSNNNSNSGNKSRKGKAKPKASSKKLIGKKRSRKSKVVKDEEEKTTKKRKLTVKK